MATKICMLGLLPSSYQATRVFSHQTPILDYFLIKKADIECYEKLEIDKDRILAPYKINCIEKQTNLIFSDHHLVQAKCNWIFQNKGNIK